MPIRFACEKCGQRLSVSTKRGGQKAKCPKCYSVLTIPPYDPAMDRAGADDGSIGPPESLSTTSAPSADDSPSAVAARPPTPLTPPALQAPLASHAASPAASPAAESRTATTSPAPAAVARPSEKTPAPPSPPPAPPPIPAVSNATAPISPAPAPSRVLAPPRQPDQTQSPLKQSPPPAPAPTATPTPTKPPQPTRVGDRPDSPAPRLPVAKELSTLPTGVAVPRGVGAESASDRESAVTAEIVAAPASMPPGAVPVDRSLGERRSKFDVEAERNSPDIGPREAGSGEIAAGLGGATSEGEVEVEWVYARPGDSPAVSRSAAAARSPHTVPVPRFAVYMQGALLAVVAGLAFVLGWQMNAGRAGPGSAPGGPVTLSGQVRYATSGRTMFPDEGAAILVVPVDERPTNDEKLALDGLIPGDPPPGPQHPATVRLRTLGGGYARADVNGDFRVSLPRGGRFYVLILSHYGKRPARVEPERAELAQLGRYVANSSELLSDRMYAWRLEELRADRKLIVNLGE